MLRDLIYFVECESFVKIGTTTDIERRLTALATTNPFECRLIGLIEGGRATERELHERFADFRHKGEWFRLTDVLSAEIVSICGENWQRFLEKPFVWSPPTFPPQPVVEPVKVDVRKMLRELPELAKRVVR